MSPRTGGPVRRWCPLAKAGRRSGAGCGIRLRAPPRCLHPRRLPPPQFRLRPPRSPRWPRPPPPARRQRTRRSAAQVRQSATEPSGTAISWAFSLLSACCSSSLFGGHHAKQLRRATRACDVTTLNGRLDHKCRAQVNTLCYGVFQFASRRFGAAFPRHSERFARPSRQPETGSSETVPAKSDVSFWTTADSVVDGLAACRTSSRQRRVRRGDRPVAVGAGRRAREASWRR